jgi:CheY-like chemotaxis protein
MKKIVLIDDDVVLGKIVQSILLDEGFDTVLQTDSIGANEVIKASCPHLIILDYFLPTENGEEVARRLKTDQQTKSIPILMVSSSYGTEAIAKKVGVEAFLPKPFDIDKLVTLVHSFMD